MNEIGLASPSSNTAALPIFTGGWPFGGSTTIPFLLLYLEAATEVNKTVVVVVPGGGAGMRLCCCILLRFVRAIVLCCSAASWNHFAASAKSYRTP